MSTGFKRTALLAAVVAALSVTQTGAALAQSDTGAARSSAYVTTTIGRSMDDADRLRLTRAMDSLPTGEQTAWKNDQSGNSYSVKLTRSYASDIGPCREFTTVGEISGTKETAEGTACRRGDGTWILRASTASSATGR